MRQIVSQRFVATFAGGGMRRGLGIDMVSIRGIWAWCGLAAVGLVGLPTRVMIEISRGRACPLTRPAGVDQSCRLMARHMQITAPEEIGAPGPHFAFCRAFCHISTTTSTLRYSLGTQRIRLHDGICSVEKYTFSLYSTMVVTCGTH